MNNHCHKPQKVSSKKFWLNFETVSKVNMAELYKFEAAYLLTHQHSCHVLDPEVKSLPIFTFDTGFEPPNLGMLLELTEGGLIKDYDASPT